MELSFYRFRIDDKERKNWLKLISFSRHAILFGLYMDIFFVENKIRTCITPAQPTASTSSSEPSQSNESSQSQSLRPNVTAQANKLVPQHETPFTLVAGKLTDTEQLTVHDCGGDGERSQGDKEGVESEEEEHPPPCKTVRMTPLEELFADEDAVKMTSLQTSISIQDRVEKELQMYKDMPPIVTSDDPAAWWWNMQTTYPCLSDMAFSF
ncbi:hypothetical protein ABVT39_012915 [Epinephelus coioides]